MVFSEKKGRLNSKGAFPLVVLVVFFLSLSLFGVYFYLDSKTITSNVILEDFSDSPGFGITGNVLDVLNEGDGIVEISPISFVSNLEDYDYFGDSVSISGDYAIVGASREDGNGAAYIFKKNDTDQFEYVNKLTAPDGAELDYFGDSVSISGDYAIVGAYGHDYNSTVTDSGSAYIFKKNSTTGQFEFFGKFVLSETVAYDYFGKAVSISGDYVILGATRDDDLGYDCGAAYIFKKNDTDQFEYVNKLTAPDGAELDYFGESVSISGDYAIVGVSRDDGGYNDGLLNTGSAYIFKKNDSGQFEYLNKITTDYSGKDDWFGSSVSISGDYAIIGAFGFNYGGVSDRGSAYIFKRNSTNNKFQQVSQIFALDGVANDFFGYSVSISGDYAIVGAYGHDYNSTVTDSGSAYIFKKNSTTGQFEYVNKIIALNGETGDVFGGSVSISGDYAIVGAIGVKNYTGSVYVYNLVESSVPEVKITYPVIDSAYVAVDEINYSVSGADFDRCWYSFDWGETNSSAVLAGVNFTDLGLSDGHYNLSVYCNDSFGNESGDNLSFLVGDFSYVSEVNKLLTSDREAGDQFGNSVSISGDYAIVGAPYDDDKGDMSGSAYIFKKNDTGQFAYVNKLLAFDGNVSDNFGNSVSISGDYAIVGALYDDDKGSASGSAYIFKKNDTGQFAYVNKLLAFYGNVSDNFGNSVSISGDYAIVGAHYGDHDGTIINSRGSAYIFKKNSTGYFEYVNKITASDGAAGDFFGESVSISGDYAIVGADWTNEGGVVGNGSAYIFKKNSTGQFEEVNKILASDGAVADQFGDSVSISGDYAIVGARWNDDKGDSSGSAYIFKKNSTGQFEEVNKILAFDGNVSDNFGNSVSISGDYAIIGANYDDGHKGSAYIFKKNSTGQFEEVNKILASDRTIPSSNSFGESVSISGDYAIVGAEYDYMKNGSVYIYNLVESSVPEVKITYPVLNGAYSAVSRISYSAVGADFDRCWYSHNNGETNSSSVLANEGKFFYPPVSLGGFTLELPLIVYCNTTSGEAFNDTIKFLVGNFNKAREVNTLLASDGAENDSFGHSVSISGDYAIVGAYKDDDKGTNGGSAYIFKKNDTGQFEYLNKINASDGAENDSFGYSVSISGDYAIIGAKGDDSAKGSAYIFKKNVTTDKFGYINKLVALDGKETDQFGSSVSISGDYAIVGAWLEDSVASDGGAAYIFKKNSAGQFEYANKLTAFDGGSWDQFGHSVSISGDYAIVGAHMDDDSYSRGGSAYIFKKNDTGQFEYVNKINASDGESGDYFGYSVSISGDYAIVGANLNDYNGPNSGLAYVFKKNLSTNKFEQVDKIAALDAGSADQFGSSVSISGDYAIVGANRDEDSKGSVYVFKKNLSTNKFEQVDKITINNLEVNSIFGSSGSLSGDYAVFGVSKYNEYTGSAYIYNLYQCVSLLKNTTKSAWVNVSCLESDLMNKSRFWTEYDENNCGKFENKTYLEYNVSEYCDYSFYSSCIENWSCTDWSSCVGGVQNRTCTDLNNCLSILNKPNESQSCSVGGDSSGGRGSSSRPKITRLDFSSSFIKRNEELEVKDKIEFYIKDSSIHTLELLRISGGRAYFVVNSNPIYFNLSNGEEKYLNLNYDTQDDFYVKVQSIGSKKTVLSIQSIPSQIESSQSVIDQVTDSLISPDIIPSPGIIDPIEIKFERFSVRNVFLFISLFVLVLIQFIILYYIISAFMDISYNKKYSLHDEAKSLIEKGLSSFSQGKKQEARSYYDSARKIFEANKEKCKDLFDSLSKLYKMISSN